MESNEQNKLRNKIETENRMISVRGEGVGELGEKGLETKRKKNSDTDNNVMITRGKGRVVVGGGRRG